MFNYFFKVLKNLDAWIAADEHFKVHWYPHTGYAKVYHVNRTSKVLGQV